MSGLSPLTSILSRGERRLSLLPLGEGWDEWDSNICLLEVTMTLATAAEKREERFIKKALRPYQAQVGRAVMRSVLHNKGLTFSVEISRQGGKNELSAQMELLLLVMHMQRGGNLVKAAPTFLPQVIVSMMRLKERLNDAGLATLWKPEAGHIICLGNARQVFFSAEKSSNVVGATAHIRLEID